jgi:hypothetical protein
MELIGIEVKPSTCSQLEKIKRASKTLLDKRKRRKEHCRTQNLVGLRRALPP